MGQLEDFRASLKRKDSAVSSEGEIPVKSITRRGMPDRIGHDGKEGRHDARSESSTSLPAFS